MTDAERTLQGEPGEPAPANDAQANEKSPGAQVPGGGSPLDGQADDAAAVEGDLGELIAVAAQRDEYLALAQRTQADFENYRKRVAREAAAAQDRGMAALAKELLPALDNLDRALGAAASDDPLLEGVRLVRAELAGALTRAGIDSYRPLGEDFDPSLHEAVATTPPGTPGAESGKIFEVYQDGYRLGDSILRPARVVVAG
jgi:molecular chaperone GrpE